MPRRPKLADNSPPATRSWAARYGQLIRQAGIAAVPTALYTYQARLGLTTHEVWFVAAVLAHKWTAAAPFPSLRKLADASGVDLRQLQRIQVSLRTRGYLQVEERFDQHTGRQDTNSYDFADLFARLEQLITADPPADNLIQAEAVTPDTPDTPLTDTSFIARFGRVIARAGVAAVPQALFDYQAALDLSPSQVWFVCYILSFRWSTELPYPSLVKMEQRTGYTRRGLQKIKDKLVTQGYLQLVTRHGSGGRQDTNGYDFSGLFDALNAHIPQEATEAPLLEQEPPAPDPPRGRRLLRPEREAVSSQEGRTVDSSQSRMVDSSQSRMVDSSQPRMVDSSHPGTVNGSQIGAVSGTWRSGEEFTGRDGDLITVGDGTVFTQRRINQEEAGEREDSNQHAYARETETPDGGRTRYSPYIAGVVLDLSRELGDTNGPSNVTQALRLWQRSGLREEEFVTTLQTARRAVRLAQAHGVVNKGAYWMAVVRDQLGLNEG